MGAEMAKNDLILIDSIINEKMTLLKIKPDKIGEFFENFCCSEILKNKDLSTEEIDSGIIDGKDDGGIDGFYIFINGHLFFDPESFIFPKTDVAMEIYIITCKHHDTFKQQTINNQFTAIRELFNLSLENNELQGCYNSKLIYERNLFIDAYRKLASKLVNLSFKFLYISRGDTNLLAENVLSQKNQIETLIKNYFSNCKVDYKFVGAAELLTIFRNKREFKLILPYQEAISVSNQKFILLSKISDYYNFLQDKDGELKRYLFDSNVRDYMGLNKVNKDILASLNSPAGIDFWWLNNGITILSSSAIDLGKQIEIENVQIVNGLQTSQTIFNYFSQFKANIHDDRMVMIKIITENKPEIRDKIIQATNNQSDVSEYSLHATDKVQQDIEDILLKNNIYYERRKNFYLNQGINKKDIITPLSLAAGYVAVIEKDISSANNLRQKFMRNENNYNRIYNTNSIEIWTKIAKILINSNKFIIKYREDNGDKVRTEKCLTHFLSLIVVAYHFKDFNYSINQVLKLTNEDIDNFDYNLVLNFILSYPNFQNLKERKRHIVQQYINDFIIYCAKELNIFNADIILKVKHKKDRYFVKNTKEISEDLLAKIRLLLPPQPWPKDIHKKIASELNISNWKIYDAIDILINNGEYFEQIDGKLIDKNGNIIETNS